MTIRRTEPAQRNTAGSPPTPSTPPDGWDPVPLRNWVVIQAATLAQGADGDPALLQARRAHTAKRWQLGTHGGGAEPVVNGGRSENTKTFSREKNAWFWTKRFLRDADIALRQNEDGLLFYFSQADPGGTLDFRQFVNWSQGFYAEGPGSRINVTQTLDGGPNLDDWQAFAPCLLVPPPGPAGLLTPAFAHPAFLAAVVRRALIALDLLQRIGVIHNDIKPDNLCLSLPEDWRIEKEKGIARGTWDLRDLRLRFIDWETGFRPDCKRLHLGVFPNGRLPWASPFAFQCHRLADGLDKAAQAVCLDAIDWGADLWSLGHMLDGWCVQATDHFIALQRAADQDFGFESIERSAVESSYVGLLDALGWLRGFARKLQAHDRPPEDAQAFKALRASASRPAAKPDDCRLPERDNPPHQALQLALEQRFPLLGAASRGSTCRFALQDPAAPRLARPAVPPPGTELTVPGAGDACPNFIVIPYTGPQTLGSGDEAITARFDYRFAMAKTQVTVGQWKVFWNAPDRDYVPEETKHTRCNWNDRDYADDDRHPVRAVNVADAEAYAHWFAKRYAGQLGVRISSIGLPTELEWEYSARGGRNSQQYLWADDADDAEICRHAQTRKSPGWVIAVGSLLKNSYGLHDMIGNVWEWTATDQRDDRKSMEANHRDDGKTGVLAARSVRGAAFNNNDNRLRLANRDNNTPGNRNNNIGFRLVARIPLRPERPGPRAGPERPRGIQAGPGMPWAPCRLGACGCGGGGPLFCPPCRLARPVPIDATAIAARY